MSSPIHLLRIRLPFFIFLISVTSFYYSCTSLWLLSFLCRISRIGFQFSFPKIIQCLIQKARKMDHRAAKLNVIASLDFSLTSLLFLQFGLHRFIWNHLCAKTNLTPFTFPQEGSGLVYVMLEPKEQRQWVMIGGASWGAGDLKDQNHSAESSLRF